MFPDVSEGWLYAFLAGLIVSPHCIAMCGPLFCGLLPLNKENARPTELMQGAYHLGRVISYSVLGFAAGFFSLQLANFFQLNAALYLPWALVIFFLGFALGLDKLFKKLSLPKLPISGLGKNRGLYAMLWLGFLTPLLPCAPLYSVFWVALISGSPAFGVEIMFAFALGTIPLLWWGQSQFVNARERWPMQRINMIQRILAGLGAAILAFRVLFIGNPFDGSACLIQL